jgi:hypothetical protein
MDSKSWTTCSPRLALQKFSFLNRCCSWVSRDTLVCTDYWLGVRWIVVRVPAGARDYSLLQSVQTGNPPLGPTQPFIQCLLRALSPGIKRLERETDHSPHTVPKSRRSATTSALLHIPSWRAKWQFHLYCFWRNDGSVTPLCRTAFEAMPLMSPEICHAAIGYRLDDWSSTSERSTYISSLPGSFVSEGQLAAYQMDTAQFLQYKTAKTWNRPLTWI